MPNRPLHPCNSPTRCPTLISAGQRLCPDHQRQANREYNQQRPARHQFYQTKEWRRLSKQVLAEEPWCACGGRTTQADHIISIKDRPDLALVRENLVGRCASCHSRKSALVDGRWDKP